MGRDLVGMPLAAAARYPLLAGWAVGQLRRGQTVERVRQRLARAEGEVFEEMFAASVAGLRPPARDLLATLPLAEMGIVNVAPAHGNFGVKDAKILVPGHPERSILLTRMEMTGLGRMPHIGSRVVDEQAVRLVHDWIKGMK